MGVRRGLTVLVVGVVVVVASGFATAPGGVGGPTMTVEEGERPLGDAFSSGGAGVSAEERLDGPSDTIRAKLQPASDRASERIRQNVTVRHEFGDVVTANVTGAEYDAFVDDPDVNVAPVQRVRLAQSGDDPDVSWVEPVDGATLEGTVDLTVESDAFYGQVERVTWRVDGESAGEADRLFWSSYWRTDWDTTDVADGTHELTAVLETAAGTTETATVEVTVDNGKQPPRVSWAAPEDGASVTGEVPLRIDASDPDGTVERVTWHADGGTRRPATPTDDGTWVATWNASDVAAGTHELTATAVDAAGADSTDTVSVTVSEDDSGEENETYGGAPSVSWQTPTEGESVEGEVQLGIAASDANGSVETVRWRVAGASQRQASYDADAGRWTATWDASRVEPGTRQLTAAAVDDTDAVSTATVSVEVGGSNDGNETGSRAPEVAWISHGDGDQVQGATGLAVAASDPDGSVETVRWRVDGGSPREATVDGTTGAWTATWNASTVDPGTHELTAVAVDDAGNRSEASIGLEAVAPPKPPTVGLESPEDGQTVNGTVPVRVSANDPDGTVREVRWRVDDGPVRRANQSDGAWTAEWNASTVAPGEHALTAAAIDDDSLIVNTSVDVTVGGPNRAPTVSWHSPHDGEELEDTVDLQIEAADPDGTIEKAAWRIDGQQPQPLTHDETSGYWEDTVDVSDLDSGTYTLTTRVADGDNETAMDTIDVEVAESNRAPVVEWDAPTDGDAVSGEVDLRIEADDPDGNLDIVRWAIEDAETPTEPSETDESGVWEDSLDATNLEDGTYTLRVGARDDEGADSYDKISVTVENDGQTGDPSVAWAWPRDGETLATHEVPVQIEADAGGGSIDAVRWQVDGGNPRTAEFDQESGYYESTWDAGTVASGSHELRTRLKTASGDTASASVEVTVGGASQGRNGSSERPPTRISYGVRAVYGDAPDGRPSGGNGVDVAVLDSGVDVDHPDLRGPFARCLDVADTGTCQDRLGHGTHVAGLVAANGATGDGMYGVAPGVNLHAYKVVDDRGIGYADDVAAAVRDAAENDVEVVALSARTEARGSLVEYAIDRHSDDLLVLAAAGNGGPDEGTIAPPAAAPSTVAVGALDRNGRVVDQSARGTPADSFCECTDNLELVSAGESVPSTWHDGGYDAISGTSVAVPHVAGVAAKAWASGAADRDDDGTVTPAEVREYLRESARDIQRGQAAGEGYDPASGVGIPTVP